MYLVGPYNAKVREEFYAFYPIQEIKRIEEKKTFLDLDGNGTDTKDL